MTASNSFTPLLRYVFWRAVILAIIFTMIAHFIIYLPQTTMDLLMSFILFFLVILFYTMIFYPQAYYNSNY